MLCYTTYRSQASTAQREVQILAKLSHKGVVRYHSGWMQEVSDKELTDLQIPASSISTGYSICILQCLYIVSIHECLLYACMQ